MFVLLSKFSSLTAVLRKNTFQIPADFPEMVESFQQPVAYMSPTNDRHVEMARDNAQPNSIGIGNGPRQQAGRGIRQFPATRNGTDWGQQRSRIGSSRSDMSDNWRGDRDAKVALYFYKRS
jgi:hypothetical protein